MKVQNENGRETKTDRLELGDLILIMPPSTWESDYPPIGLFIKSEESGQSRITITIETWSNELVPNTTGRLCQRHTKSYEVEEPVTVHILAKDSQAARALLNYVGCPTIKADRLQKKIDEAIQRLQ